MSILKVTYGDLSIASNHAKKAANELENYASKLERGVARKISSISGGASSRTNNALSETWLKIQELKVKRDNLNNYASRVEKFENNVKDADEQMSKKIKTSSLSFAKDHGFKVGKVSAFFEALVVNTVNSSSLGRWVKDVYNKAGDKVNEWKTELKHWYKTGGGKYIGDIAISIGAIACSVLVIVGTIFTGGALVFAIAGVVASLFAMADRITKVCYDVKAINSNNNGDPVWAARYGKIDKLTKHISSNYNSKGSKMVVSILDKTEFAANIISAVGSIGSLAKLLTTPGKMKGFVSVKQLFGSQNNARSVGIIGSKFKVFDGNKKVFTFKSIGNGLKSLVYDDKFRMQIGKSCSLFKDELIDLIKYKKSNIIQAKSLISNGLKGDGETRNRSIGILKSIIKSDLNSFKYNSFMEVKKELKNIKNTFIVKNKKSIGEGIKTIGEFGKKVTEGKSPYSIFKFTAPNFDKLYSGIGDIKEAIDNYGKSIKEQNKTVMVN